MMRKLIPMFPVALVAAILAVPASASADPTTATASAASAALVPADPVLAYAASSYCGPPAMNKTQWVGFWKRGGALTKGAERWVRQHASYTHIKPDQGFLSWAKQPEIKSVYTPAGYTLSTNTFCPGGTYLPYNGRLPHGKQKVMAWCEASAKNHVIVTKVKKHGRTYFRYVTMTSLTCVPLVKGYCRNFVTGKPFKVVKRKVKYRRVKTKKVVKPKKPAPEVKCSTGFDKVIVGTTVSCIQQTQRQSSEQSCRVAGGNWNGVECLSVQVQVQVVCGNATVVVGNNTTAGTQGDNCNTVVNPPPSQVCPPPTTGTYPNCTLPPPPPTCEDQGLQEGPYGECEAKCPDAQATDATLSGFGYRTGNFLGITGGYFQYYVWANSSGRLFFANDYTSVQASYKKGSPICGKANPAGPGGSPPPPSP